MKYFKLDGLKSKNRTKAIKLHETVLQQKKEHYHEYIPDTKVEDYYITYY